MGKDSLPLTGEEDTICKSGQTVINHLKIEKNFSILSMPVLEMLLSDVLAYSKKDGQF